MPYKTLIFGVDDIFNELNLYYEQEVQRGTLEVVGYVLIENGKVNIVDTTGRRGGVNQFQLVIISSQNDFYRRMKFLEAQGISRNRIIDGRVFKVPNLDFPRLVNEGVAYGVFEKNLCCDMSFTIYPRIYINKGGLVILGSKSYLDKSFIDGKGIISVEKFSSLAWEITFELGLNLDHNLKNIGQYGWLHFDWAFPEEFYSPQGQSKILIGSDVWIGRGCKLKCSNPEKPLIIGDGAVIASDSVVVKNVPPYAIVGGNPAQIIKYRFPPHVVEALLRIKWWNWSLDKIHDNFRYFNDIERFISLHDKE